ncbi:hypothetical protein A2774_04800 [Candidatus Roizmanbacteria bacterium RIFCSPHIGHO2_01_FULL_39_12c]|uniref:OmpR/PhoB-type domain-containing protein n=1 Tax=Candidatus Roizmanbacteria bacterium RIFCSPHIGHO2_01_FULL_39_12c TaxID=1802031 RepID=A0A1F7GF80_9BACT|nr:MAG: hypothetical protein A2774_04800 [Candidatus Roizmanbacteria bacterium RIFCSPHIGHO2_01_FULL_39_12c]
MRPAIGGTYQNDVDKNMKTRWEWSVETEAQRLIFIARNIATGFYERNSFLVLPPKYLKKSSEIIVFPEIEVGKIDKFWTRVKSAKIDRYPVSNDRELIELIVKYLTGDKIREPEIDNLKIQWERAEKDVLKEIERILTITSSIQAIIIHPSNFGASVSYNVVKNTSADIQLFLRFDQNIHTIAEGVISSLLHDNLIVRMGGTFKEKEFLIDWLVGESSIGEILRKFEPRSKFIPTSRTISKKQTSELSEVSSTFLQKLGRSRVGAAGFSLKGKNPYYCSEPLRNLNWQEKRALCLMIENKDRVVEFDEIGQIIYKNDAEFSLWAVAKFIQRLREKLEANGVSGDYIQTVRRRGYTLR